ncbi:MAG: VCBS repeat-containing protein, partial [Planctomycetes bacterium]|nr:VCBS repeat-containing protein [Planctomycetota bacterium]
IHQTQVGKTAGLFKVRHNQWRYVDFDGDGAVDLVVAIEDWADYGWDDAWDATGRWTNGPLHGLIYILRNSGAMDNPKYAEPVLLEAEGQRIDTFGCPSPNFADFDGDGDLDLLCGEFLDSFSYFENVGSRTHPMYSKARRLMCGNRPLTMDLEMIIPVAFDWDKDGDSDLIVGDEDGRVAFVENTGRIVDRLPQFELPRYFQQEADELQCGALATPVGCDWDGDGDIDIVSGNTAGYIELFENLSGPKQASPKWAAPRRLKADGKTFRVMAGPNGSIQGPAEAKWGYTTLNVADWNADGLLDIVFNSIWGRVEWLRNVGTSNAPRLAAPQPIEVDWHGAPPKPTWTWWTPRGKELVTQWRTTPVLADWTGDGRLDLAMLDQEGFLSLFERCTIDGQLQLLPPRRVFLDEKAQPLHLNAQPAGRSGRRKLCATDWDGDGRLDLLVNSENANWLRQIDSRDGNWLFKDMGPLDNRDIASHDVSPTAVDWDGDGVPDYLGGAEDGFFYFLRNLRSK